MQKKLLGQEWLRWIMVSAVSRQASYVAQQQIESLLRDRHKIRSGDPDDFVVRNLADMADAAAEQGTVMTVLLTIVASIALLVGGIGIMNIMLVSVTERTREIGIRMAVGATEEDVRLQFLIEALRAWPDRRNDRHYFRGDKFAGCFTGAGMANPDSAVRDSGVDPLCDSDRTVLWLLSGEASLATESD